MAKNLISAVVNTSIMEGTEATYTVDVRDYCGSSVDVSLVTLEWGVNASDGTLVASGRVSWNSTLGAHQMTFPELSEGIYEYHISITEDDGSRSVLVQGTLGVFDADSWQEPVMTTNSPNRCLRIWRADGKEQIEASWLATAAAEGFAYKAKKYAQYLEDAMPLIEQAKAFIESFDEALREAIKVVDNYLYIGGVSTGHYLRGDDGETPRYKDGYWFIGSECVGKARGDDGITPHITSDGYWAFGSQKTNVKAAGRDGVDGAAVRRILARSYEDIPKEGETCNGGFYYYVPNVDNSYDVYAWLEPVGWVCVGVANDIATPEVHGLVKLGTDVPVEDGAPVGTNANGQMAVPVADSNVSGTGKLSYDYTLDAQISGKVGKSADNRFCVAAPELYEREKNFYAYTYGCVAPSRTDELAKVLCIGIIPENTTVDGHDRAGQLGCTRAQDDTYGVVKVQYTSTSDKCNNVLWNVPIGIRDDHTGTVAGTSNAWYRGANGMLFIPLAENGAIQWNSTKQKTRDGKIWSTGGELVFKHSTQFTQGVDGLQLNAASMFTLAGVYLATSFDDDREAAVFTVSNVKNYLGRYYYTAAQVYTKAETDTAISKAQASSATKSWVQATYMPRTEVTTKLAEKIDCPSKRISHLEIITASEREAMTSMNSKTVYLVIAG